MLRLALPKGSLEEETRRLFREASLDINGDEDSAWIDDRRISETRFFRAQDIAKLIEERYFDLGITGYDWIREPRADILELSDLGYGKVRLVLFVAERSGITEPRQIKPNSVVTSEYENLTRDYFEGLGIPIRYRPSYGATEQKVSARVADIGLDNRATPIGRRGTIEKAGGLRIIDTYIESTTRLITNEECYSRNREDVDDITVLLDGARDARNKVVLEMNVPQYALDRVAQELPSMRSPTISQLYNGGAGIIWYAVKTVVSREEAKELIPRLKRYGVKDIIEYRLTKVIR